MCCKTRRPVRAFYTFIRLLHRALYCILGMREAPKRTICGGGINLGIMMSFALRGYALSEGFGRAASGRNPLSLYIGVLQLIFRSSCVAFWIETPPEDH